MAERPSKDDLAAALGHAIIATANAAAEDSVATNALAYASATQALAEAAKALNAPPFAPR